MKKLCLYLSILCLGGGVSTSVFAGKHIYVSGPEVYGNMELVNGSSFGEGIAGADKICQEEYGDTFKALIVTDDRYPGTRNDEGEPRYGSSHAKDWVLTPHTHYYSKDENEYYWDIEIGETNGDAIFKFALNHAVLDQTPSGEVQLVWTGMYSDWTPSKYNCDSWRSKYSDGGGRVGVASSQDAGSISKQDNGDNDCGSARNIYCVEQ